MNRVTSGHAENLVRWAKDRPEVVLLSGDLTGSTDALGFKQNYPERFYSLGLTEQNMMSWAAGMAREGFTPFVHTFCVFMYRRALDQIAVSIAYPNLKVRLFGFLPGLTTPGGVTHQAIDDINVFRGLPNFTILEVGDATDIDGVLEAAETVPGPVYIRMLRGEVPRLFPKGERLTVNCARVLSRGEDLTVISTGVCTEEAQIAVGALQKRGVAVEHLHVTTLKPFDDPQVVKSIAGAKHGVVTVENHSVIGGIGSAVSDVITTQGLNKVLLKMGIPDTFLHGASQRYLMRECEIDARSIFSKSADMIGADFGSLSEALETSLPQDQEASPRHDF